MKKTTIISVALSGSHGSKKLNKHTPVTNDEMIEDAYQCYLQGASIVHIHAKGSDLETYEIDTENIQYIIDGIANKCDMIVNVTTSGEEYNFEGLQIKGELTDTQDKRMSILELKPEIVSYDVPTMNLGNRVFINPLSYLRSAGRRMQELNILPEVEIFNLSDITQATRLMEEGNLSQNVFFQLCLGVEGGTPATVKNLVFLQDALPRNLQWSAFGVGNMHLPIMYATLALGGHIRVGLEDNLYYSYKQLTSNVELVKRASRVIREFGNEPATPSMARQILGIS